MSFVKKIWKNREVEHPNRRYLAPTQEENVYDLIRHEGNVEVEGDYLDSTTLNDLEERIYQGIANAEATLSSLKIRGHVDSTSDLPSTGQEGWIYSVGDDDILYCWDVATSTWKSIGKIQGVTLPLSVVDGKLCITYEKEDS